MQSVDIPERVAVILAEGLHVEAPGPNTDLIDQGLLDSLSLIDLLVKLEESFGVTISLDELEIDHFRSVSSIAKFVESRIESRA